ncbi:hypothetical protein [Dactylosporangium salmoneum]|uniref:hypothetical protein n=1 Tax=Dactylosporangium salmoneum TaxID=53361 RepID=UPI0031D84DF9
MTFERMLIERLNATGQVKAQSYHEAGASLLYGVLLRAGSGNVAVRLTKGSGTGDPKPTEQEQAEHDAYVARAAAGKQAPRSQSDADLDRKVSNLMRDVLAADLPPTAVGVEGRADGRERPGVKIRFDTGAEIYMTPVA